MNLLLITGVLAAVGVMLFLLLTIYRRVVPTNMVHIVQSGKKTISYGAGKESGNTYYEWPERLPILGVKVTTFQESIFQITLNDYDAYDSSKLPFNVSISAFFRVESADKVAQRVATFEELKMQLADLLRGSVRRVLGSNKLEEIMQERSTYGTQFTNEVKSQLTEWGVVPVKTIEFMDIKDAHGSNVISDIMAKEQSRIGMESRIAVAENNQEAELKEIDAKRTVDVQAQDALQQVGLRTAEKEKTVGIALEKSKQDVQEQAKITAEKDMGVKKVHDVQTAEINKEVAIVKAAQDNAVLTATAEAKKIVQITEAKANQESTIAIATGQLEAAKFNAQGIEVEGAARASAEAAMLLAPITTQITLAKEIGENEGYQQYLITIKQVETSGNVGIQLAKAMENADMKIIANSGDVQSGVNSLGDIFTAKGGLGLTAMMEAIGTTPTGAALLNKVTGSTAESNILKNVKPKTPKQEVVKDQA
jgi:flotillin